MGITNLNYLIYTKAPHSVQQCKMTDFKGKIVAVDLSYANYTFWERASIAANRAAELEDLKMQFTYFEGEARKHNIQIIYVADGKAGKEKDEETQQRIRDRETQREKIRNVRTEIELCEDSGRKVELANELKRLEQKAIWINPEQRSAVMEHLRTLDCNILQAINEADELLASLSQFGHVDYILSKDTDMLAHGCRYVLREKHDVEIKPFFEQELELVDYVKLLDELRMSSPEFTEMCVLLGCDYYKATLTHFKAKRDKYWACRVYEAIQKHRNIANIIYLGVFRKTHGFTVSEKDWIDIQKALLGFQSRKLPSEFTNDIINV